MVGWAVAGIGVAAVLLTLVAAAPEAWHRKLETAFVVLCPPSILLMAFEVCAGWLSWCGAEIVLLITALNALLYVAVGTAGWLLLTMLSFLSRRRHGAD